MPPPVVAFYAVFHYGPLYGLQIAFKNFRQGSAYGIARGSDFNTSANSLTDFSLNEWLPIPLYWARTISYLFSRIHRAGVNAE